MHKLEIETAILQIKCIIIRVLIYIRSHVNIDYRIHFTKQLAIYIGIRLPYLSVQFC